MDLLFNPWFFLTLSLLYFLRVARDRFVRSAKLPPGPTPLPIVGSLFELGDSPHQSLARLAKTYGPVMRLRLGLSTTIVISSPDAAREVLQVHDQSLSGRACPESAKALGHHEVSMAWLPPAPLWKNLRAIVKINLLTAHKLDENQGLRRQKVEELVEHVRARSGRRLDIGQAALCTSINLLSNTLVSVDLVQLGAESGQEFKKNVRDIMEELGAPNLGDFFPVLGAIDVQGRRRRLAAPTRKLYDFFGEMIDQRLLSVDQGKRSPDSTHDFLDSLVLLHLQGEGKIDKRSMIAILSDTFVAGSDTSSKSVEWAMAELLRNPNAMSKLRAELDDVIGPGQQVEESDIPRLPYLRAVVKETWRMHPPAPLLLPHRAEESAEVGGYIVPKHSRVLVNAWAIGHDEKVWHEPESFKPERFLSSDVDIRGRNFELIPFGSGRRICPGLPLAYRMVHLTIGALVHSFEWKLTDGMKPEEVDVTEKFGVTLGLAVPLPAISMPKGQ